MQISSGYSHNYDSYYCNFSPPVHKKDFCKCNNNGVDVSSVTSTGMNAGGLSTYAMS